MKISSIQDLQKVSNKIRKKIIPGDVLFLYGQIGVGKTTFTRMLINGFEKENKLKKSEVLSPTFNIVFEYDIKEFTIKHFDLYRLKFFDELKNIGLFENLNQNITLIEWPELIKNRPKNRLDLFFKYAENYDERSLIIKPYGRLKTYEFE